MKMSSFWIDLKKVVNDSYDIEIGKGLSEKLLTDIQNGRQHQKVLLEK